MFINKLFSDKVDAVTNDRAPLYRVQNVIWASEGTADLGGGICIGECQRSLFYRFMGQDTTNPMSVRVRNICDSGIMYEDKLITDFKRKGMYVDDQIRMEYVSEKTRNKVITSGKMDLMILEDGKYIGIEIKSISSYKVATVFGDAKNFPLPAAKNLIQAMHYKRKSMLGPVLCNDKEERTVEEVYLLYVDRATGCTMYFKVDIDPEGYAIITPIDEAGKVFETVHLQNVDGFDVLATHPTAADKQQARLAELKFSLDDVMARFDEVYDYARSEPPVLPPKTYSLIYTDEEVEKQYHCGLISKLKYNKHFKKHEPIGDMLCSFCNYKETCLKDDGVVMA